MVRVGYISDSHLGYRSGKKVNEEHINIRENDGYEAFKECIDNFIKEKVDLVIIGGDLFHSPKPTITTIVKTREQLERLSVAKIPTYIITGNHDTSDIRSEYSSVLAVDTPSNGIFATQDNLKIVEVENIRFYLVSHQTTKEQLKTFGSIELDKSKTNILVTHGSCFDTNIGAMLHTELEPREVVITEEVFEMGWDYTLMGHIHTRGWVHSTDGKTDTSGRKQYYGGSLIRRGFADEECKLGRGYTIVEINGKDINLDIRKIYQRPQYDLLVFAKNKSIEELQEEINTKLSKVDTVEMPIVRINVIGINKANKKSLDWKRAREIAESFLTFTINYKNEEEIKTEVTEYETMEVGDILNDFNSYWQNNSTNIEKQMREDVKTKSEGYIKVGMNESLKE